MNFTQDNWNRLCDACEGQIGQMLLAKMTSESVKTSLFGDTDEEVYVCCTKLMQAYKDTINLYERFQKDITTPDVADILDGIITVLVSRLREFEEASGSVLNPITQEKQLIIAEALESLTTSIHQNVSACLQGDFLPLYESYNENLTTCGGMLNDLDSRRMVQFYLTLMEDEWEILSSIIKIQVRALEQAVDNAPSDANTLEKVAIHKILTMLREAYQHFGRSSTETFAIFHNPEVLGKREKFVPTPYDDFCEILRGCVDNKAFKEFYAEIRQEVEAVFGRQKMESFKAIYNFRRMVNDEMMLAEEMINIFKMLHESWLIPVEEGEGTDIVKGVGETIEIKIESLSEAMQLMREETNKLIESFSPNVAPTEEEVKSATEAACKVIAENKLENIDYDNLPIFAERKLNQEKSIKQFQENFEKKLIKFKREVLLYEISTYEEIIFYSISRLRESMEHIETVNLADSCLTMLEIMLKKSNIEVIRPTAHDMFNPKEHEVLMAESNPDFKKGEIVKMMNSGYKQGDTILLRANVIAAR